MYIDLADHLGPINASSAQLTEFYEILNLSSLMTDDGEFLEMQNQKELIVFGKTLSNVEKQFFAATSRI